MTGPDAAESGRRREVRASAARRAALLVPLLAAAALAGWPAGGVSGGAPSAVPPPAALAPGPPLARYVTRLDADGRRRLAATSWSGGAQTAATGEEVTVFVSATYAADEGAAQRWADFFASLLHGPELATVVAYVAPRPEVEQLCGGPGVLGCYDGRSIVTIGDPFGRIPATAVAAHEYGHHVAMNRVNAPWRAVDWGTKRWASRAGVCARVAAGTAFPGNEGARYTLNPGEAFAEAYRVVNEVRNGATTFDWFVVDDSFRPDAAALAGVEEDVLRPWTAPTTSIARTVPARRAATWTLRVATPLDGDLRVRLRLRGGAHDVALLSGDGRLVLARGRRSAGGARTIERRICGERSVLVRVTRTGPPAPFELSVVAP